MASCPLGSTVDQNTTYKDQTHIYPIKQNFWAAQEIRNNKDVMTGYGVIVYKMGNPTQNLKLGISTAEDRNQPNMWYRTFDIPASEIPSNQAVRIDCFFPERPLDIDKNDMWIMMYTGEAASDDNKWCVSLNNTNPYSRGGFYKKVGFDWIPEAGYDALFYTCTRDQHQTCEEIENPTDCVANDCFWYNNSCHTNPQGAANCFKAVMCNTCTNDVPPQINTFKNGEKANAWCGFAAGHDFTGETIGYKWYHNGNIVKDETIILNQPFINGFTWCPDRTIVESSGIGYVQFYHSGVEACRTNEYTVENGGGNYWIEGQVTSDWAETVPECAHGGEKRTFQVGEKIWWYAEWHTSTSLLNRVLSAKWVHNGEVVHEKSATITEDWSWCCWAGNKSLLSPGTGKIEFYLDGDYLDETKIYTVEGTAEVIGKILFNQSTFYEGPFLVGENAMVAIVAMENIGTITGKIYWKVVAFPGTPQEILLESDNISLNAGDWTTRQHRVIIPNSPGQTGFGYKLWGESENEPNWGEYGTVIY